MSGTTDTPLSRPVPPMRDVGQESAAVRSAAMTPLLPANPGIAVAALMDLLGTVSRKPVKMLAVVYGLICSQAKVLAGGSLDGHAEIVSAFTDERWSTHPYFRRMLQLWLAIHDCAEGMLSAAGMDAQEKRRAEFYLAYLLGGLSPANFVLTNPEAIDATVEQRGRNLLLGMQRFWRDLVGNHGLPTQVDRQHLEVGRNLAATAGKVIFRCELYELIQYEPRTASVHGTPLLLVSSYVNRGYILDLKPGRSLVEYMVTSGFTVFTVYWRNPGKAQRSRGYDAYVGSVIDAVEIVRQICGHKAVHLAGSCAGGILATLAAAVLESRGKPWVGTLTTIVSVLDARPEDTEAGTLCTEQAVKLASHQVSRQGLLEARQLLWSFNLMQPERLIWSTAVDYYLLGKNPGTSEVMFWLNDQANLPETLYKEHLQVMLKNPFVTPGAFTVQGVAIDLTNLSVDNYVVGAFYDHICPWGAVFRSAGLMGGETEFVLTNGGHITPTITPVDSDRARHYTYSNADVSDEDWLAEAQEHSGSWQRHWVSWLGQQSKTKVRARSRLGGRRYPPLCNAPGTYVLG